MYIRSLQEVSRVFLTSQIKALPSIDITKKVVTLNKELPSLTTYVFDNDIFIQGSREDLVLSLARSPLFRPEITTLET